MIPLNAAGDLDVSRYEYHTTSESLAIAPRLRLDVGESWRVSLSAVYGEETVNLARYTYTNNVQTGKRMAMDRSRISNLLEDRRQIDQAAPYQFSA